MGIRTKILDAALRVFAETGYRGATTRRIAQEAAVNEVTLFRQFGSKDELIREAVKYAATEEVPVQLPEVPVDPYRELMEWACEHARKLRQRGAVIRTCLGESYEHPDMTERMSEGPVRVGTELRAYLNALREQGQASDAVDIDVAASMLMSVLFTDAISRDLMPRLYRYDVEEAPARYVQFILHALGVLPKHAGAGALNAATTTPDER
jgi:AcrR family transcriptional regulator